MEWKEQRLLLGTAIDEIADMLEDIHDMSRPGLGNWNLAGLIGHFLRALRTPVDYLELPVEDDKALPNAAAYYAAYLSMRARHPAAIDAGVAARGSEEIGAAAGHPSPAIRSDGKRLDNLLDRTVPDRLIQTPLGSIRLGDYMRTRVMEVVVHGLDIARAVGDDWQPPPALIEDCLRLLASVALQTGSAGDLLLVLTGRIDSSASKALPILR